MRKIVTKTCKKCGGIYLWSGGGIVAEPKEFGDDGLCEMCRAESVKSKRKKFFDAIRNSIHEKH